MKVLKSNLTIILFFVAQLIHINLSQAQQTMAAFFASVNNIEVGHMQSNIVQAADVYGTIRIPSDGNDGFSNIQIKIYDQNNNLIETLSYPQNISGTVLQGWKAEYIGLSGSGNSCTNGGKDRLKFEDGNGIVTYDNPDQCVKLASSQQSMPAFFASVNNIEAGQMQSNIVQAADDGGDVFIPSDGYDNISNINVKIFDQNNNLIETLEYPGNISGTVLVGWKVEYIALSGAGSSCTNGGKDWVRFDDGNGITTYNNPDQCVKLAAPLPLKWVMPLSAVIYNQQSIISWAVASQYNNSHFIVEHSNGTESFTELGTVQSHSTSKEIKQYSYIHKMPTNGNNYYRIRQVDYDGQYSYSDVAMVAYLPKGQDVNIYPNPAASEITVQVSEPTEIIVNDILGKVLLRRIVSIDNNVVDLSNLPNGIFIMTIGSKIVKKIIKQ